MTGGRLEATTPGSFKSKSRSKLPPMATVPPAVQRILVPRVLYHRILLFYVAWKQPEASGFKFHFSLLYLSISSIRFGTIFWQRSSSKVTLSSCILACFSRHSRKLLEVIWNFGIGSLRRKIMLFTFSELIPSDSSWSRFLVSGPNEAQVLDVSSQEEFSEGQSDR